MMRFHAIGMDMRHSEDFFIDRPNGSGDDLLIIFKTRAFVELNGRETAAPPGSAVIFSTGSPQRYRAAGSVYVNDYLHFEHDGSDCGVPFDRLFSLDDSYEAEEIMRLIGREQLSESKNRDIYMDMLIKMLMLKISDNITDISYAPKNFHASRLNALRAEIYSSPGQFTAVEQLAEKLNFSPSYFQQLYRESFGISCYEDLLSAKVRSAQYYLSTTDLPVKEIAQLSGYENEICFMRRFKIRTGMTPTQYRKTTKNMK